MKHFLCILVAILAFQLLTLVRTDATEEKAKKLIESVQFVTVKLDKGDVRLARSTAIRTGIINAIVESVSKIDESGAGKKLDLIISKLGQNPEDYISSYKIISEIPTKDIFQILMKVSISDKVLNALAHELGLEFKDAVAQSSGLERVLVMLTEVKKGSISYWWRPDQEKKGLSNPELAIGQVLKEMGVEPLMRLGLDGLQEMDPMPHDEDAMEWVERSGSRLGLIGTWNQLEEGQVKVDMRLIRKGGPAGVVSFLLKGPPPSEAQTLDHLISGIRPHLLSLFKPQTPPKGIGGSEIVLRVQGFREIAELKALLDFMRAKNLLPPDIVSKEMTSNTAEYAFRSGLNARELARAMLATPKWPSRVDISAASETQLTIVFDTGY